MFTWRKNSFLRPRTHDIFSIVRGFKLYIFIYNTRGNDKSFLTIRDFVLMSNIIFIYLFIIYIIYLCLCKFTVILHHHWFPFATCTIVRAFLMNYVFFFFFNLSFFKAMLFQVFFLFYTVSQITKSVASKSFSALWSVYQNDCFLLLRFSCFLGWPNAFIYVILFACYATKFKQPLLRDTRISIIYNNRNKVTYGMCVGVFVCDMYLCMCVWNGMAWH